MLIPVCMISIEQTLKKTWAQLALIALAFIPAAGQLSIPITGDQKQYLSTALEMMEQKNYWVPILFGEPSYYKPPLQHWATITGIKLLGYNLWGAYIPSALALLITAWFLAKTSRLLNRSAVNFSALLFAFSLGSLTFGSVTQMEIYLCLLFSAGFYFGLRFARSWDEQRPRFGFLYLTLCCAGLLALVKSPVYSVFFVCSFFGFLFFSGRRRVFLNPHLWISLMLGILIGAFWFSSMIRIGGERFISDYLSRETREKRGGNGGPFYSLWLALMYFFVPFILLGLGSLLRKVRTPSPEAFRLALCWCLPLGLFFSAYPYRVSTYLYPLLPVWVLWTDRWLMDEGDQPLKLRLLQATAVLLALCCLVSGAVLFWLGLFPFWLAAGFLLVGVLQTGILVLIRKFELLWPRFLLVCFLLIVLMKGGLGTLGEQDVSGLRDFQAHHSGLQLAMIDEGKNIWHEVGLLSLRLRKPVLRLYSIEEGKKHLSSGGALVLSDEQALLYPLAREPALVSTGWQRWRKKQGINPVQLIENLKSRNTAGLFQNLLREFVILYPKKGS